MTETLPQGSQRCVHVLISGRVQGVGFRAYTEAMANQAGVTGWVRNHADGRVEAVFEGSPAAVDSMVRWCHQGSPSAQVSSVETKDCVPEGWPQFAIRPSSR